MGRDLDKKYDLEERTAKFAEDVIKVLKELPSNPINTPLISQCIKSAGSIGANYCEANEAESKKDFIHKISICKKEIKETKYWLRLIARANPKFNEVLYYLQKEVHEFLLIFSKILKSTKNKL